MNRYLFPIILAAGMAFRPMSAQGEVSSDFLSPQSIGYMHRASEFSDEEMYEAAINQLQRLQTAGVNLDDDEREKFLLLLGRSFSNTANPACLSLLEEYLSLYSASSDAAEARMSLADFYFYSGDYPRALEEYNLIENDALPARLKVGSIYRRAFAMLKCGFFKEADSLFAEIEKDPEYAPGALFGQAYSAYMTGDYPRALSLFKESERVSNNEDIIELNPGFYIAQIQYHNGKYSEALATAGNIKGLNRQHPLYAGLKRVEGLSLFKTDEYEAALPLLEEYVSLEGDDAAHDARYALGVLLYEEDRTDQAAKVLSIVAEDEDALGQGALLYLGQIAMLEGDNNAASILLEKSYRLGFDRNVSRKALYNYIVANSRGGRVPFSSQIDTIERYLSEYPESENSNEVREYLALAYFKEKNYSAALAGIETIPNPSGQIKAAKQKILYELGVQEMQNGKYDEAVSHLQQAVSLGNLNAGILPQARLWLGDALYSTKDYSRAATSYSEAKKELKGVNRGLAIYGEAYSLQQQDKFSMAAALFRQASTDESLPERIRTDAMLRQADCLYYSGQNREAAAIYGRLGESGIADSDYAAWREAEIYGVNGDVAEKIRRLKKLSQTASDRWMPEILTSLAEAEAETGKLDNAEATTRRLMAEYPSSEVAPRALISLAEAYLKRGDLRKAEKHYTLLMQTWPTSLEARQADAELRGIHASNGTLQEYAEFLNTLPGNFVIEAAEMEELGFRAAMEAFNEDEKDISKAESYLQQFPDGPNAIEAVYMVARGKEASGDKEGACRAYLRLEQSGNPEYASEAAYGIMRTLSDAKERLKYARIVADSSGIGAERRQEALFVEAEALADSGKENEASEIWKQLSANPDGLYGARSAVEYGNYLYKKKQYAKAESELLKFIDSETPHQYWLARGYILLADIYIAEGKRYLAKQYLESLRDNYPGNEDDIKKMISNRLSKL